MKKILFLSLCIFTGMAFAQDRSINFQYAPPFSYTQIGFPDDYHKTLVNGDGALLYDLGPGPYTTKANTIVSIRSAEGNLLKKRQTYDDPRIPIVRTDLESILGSKVLLQTFALIPNSSQQPIVNASYTRFKGYTGALGWAEPLIPADPAFNNVAWGTVRPIQYRLKVPIGAKKQVVMGVCESYRIQAGMRIMDYMVEGAPSQRVDPLANGRTNEPQVFIFQGQDQDRDGDIEVEVIAPEGDPNTILNVVWMFPTNKVLDKNKLIKGELTRQAEIYIDAGNEVQVQNRAVRTDVLHATFDGSITPQFRVQTKRFASYDPLSKRLMYNGKPFVATQPHATVEQVSNTEFLLTFPKGTKTVTALVYSNNAPSNMPIPNIQTELSKSKDWWLKKSGIVQNRIQIPDSTLQAILEVQNRMLFQAREKVDGKVQFQPSFTVYRGLWIHDAAYMMDAALMLGDANGVKEAIEGIMNQRNKKGLIEVMKPNPIYRETPISAWNYFQYGKRTSDWAHLRTHWTKIKGLLDMMKKLRDQTLSDPSALNYGLLPAGFTDGGYAFIKPEYTGIVWALIALHDGAIVADQLGFRQDASAWRNLYQEMLPVFHKAIKRDARKDEFGNWCIPVLMGQKANEDVPMRAQWIFLESLIQGGNREIVPDSLLTGTLKMLSSHLNQGLPESVGFMTGGIWSVYGALYADGLNYNGESQKAIDAIYAMANHATPVATWVEEQMPKNKPVRTMGDAPHVWGSATLIRALVHTLAYEDGKNLKLLQALPAQWIKPKALISLNEVQTLFGKISLKVQISQDGNTALIQLQPIGKPDQQGEIEMSLATFKQLGFQYANRLALPDKLSLKWAENIEVLLKKN